MAHILIIEDDERVRRLYSTLLQHAGHQASEARDGREGLAIQAERHADLVITDIVMPGMEGLETISALHRSEPELPIIAISGVANAHLYLASSRAMGARYALTKPISAAALTKAVDFALANAS